MRQSELTDLTTVASWVTTQEECDIWSGGSVHFPIEMNQAVSAICWHEAFNYSFDRSGSTSAFGQLLKKPDGRLHLARIIVSPKHRGLGLGKLLVDGLINEARSKQANKVSLNVHPSNRRAIHLYSEHGFNVVEDRVENRNGLFVYMERSGYLASV